MAHHIMVPKQGVAVHINAFNFPVWGMLEKCAVNWMAGMPAVVLPAPQTAYLAEAVVKEIIASGILPEGAIQLISGTARNILDTVQSQDVVTISAVTTEDHLRVIVEGHGAGEAPPLPSICTTSSSSDASDAPALCSLAGGCSYLSCCSLLIRCLYLLQPLPFAGLPTE